MALVKGGRYYQQSVRVNGRVTTRYIGKDGVIFAAMDQEIRAEKQPELDRLKAFRDEQERIYNEEQKRGAHARILVATALTALGFERQHRKAWRKKSPMSTPPVRHPNRGVMSIRQRMRELVNSVFRDEAGALEELRSLSKAHPQEFATEVQMDLFALLIDFASAYAFTGGDKPGHSERRADMEARMRLMAVELAGENPSEASRLCGMAGAFAWADFCVVSAGATYNGLQKCGHPMAVRRRNAAHRRLMTALKTLAQIKAAEGKNRRMTVSFTPTEGKSVFSRIPSMGETMASIGAKS